MAYGAALAAMLGAVAGCKKPTSKRTGDAAPVEVIATPALPDAGVRGAVSDEVEPNDGDDAATLLAPGATVHAKIEPEADVDHYRIDVAEAGALSVMVDAHDGLDVVLEITDASGSVIARSDRGGARVREGVPNLAVAPGRYSAVVQARKPAPPKKKPGKRGAPPPAPPPSVGGAYEISAASIEVPAGAEHEPDEDRGAANDLIVGDTVSGHVGWASDLDLWKVSLEALSAKNALDIELSAVEGVALSVDVSSGIGQLIMSRKGPKGGPLVVRGFVPNVPPGAPPYHYVTVRADRSNPETPYQLRMVAKVMAPDAEVEPNDTPDTAMAMPTDRKSLRAHWSTGDVDCIALPVEEADRTLDLAIDTPGELDLAIDVLVDGKRAFKVDHPGKGAAEKLTAQVPGGARAVVQVHGSDLAGDAAYELVISEGAAPP